jgi:phosphoribosyl 1,2-cyclic phosphodiesterase
VAWLLSHGQGELDRGSILLNVTFHGVRGSTPCSSQDNRRYGGNTACVALESPGADPVVLDLGTGFRFFGQTQPHDGTFHAHVLVTHLHWDHVQGLPFCGPIHVPGARLDVYGPSEGIDLAEAFDEFIRPPFFPVRVGDLIGDVAFHTLEEGDLVVGDAKVLARQVPHTGTTFGYRVELDGVSVAYVSDHQQPLDGGDDVAEAVLELADGVDVLIHDAQYTAEEFAAKAHWGHCTVDYAVNVAARSGARRLVLFHHDPAHTDDVVDQVLAEARERGAELGVGEVLAAAEGTTLSL